MSSKTCCPLTPSTSISPVVKVGFTVIIKDFGISIEVKVSPMIIELEQSYKLPTKDPPSSPSPVVFLDLFNKMIALVAFSVIYLLFILCVSSS